MKDIENRFLNFKLSHILKFYNDGELSDFHIILGSFIVIIFETTLLNSFRILNTIPNIMLIFIIIISVIYNRLTGIKSAVYAGLITDILIGRGLGIYILYYLFVVYIISSLEDIIFKDNYITPLLLIVSSTIVFQVYMLVINYFYLGTVDLRLWTHYKLIPEIVYNLVVGLPMYTIIFNKYKGYNMR